MDSSGSLQSSSGGDDEYDSRTESVSAFFNSTSSSLGGALANHQPPSTQLPAPPSSSSSSSQHHLLHQNPNHPTSLFDPLSNYFDVFSTSTPPPPTQNSPLWTLRSEPMVNSSTHLMSAASSSSTQPTLLPPHNQVQFSQPPTSSSDQPNAARQSKKRSRASRRAPTTVLTTDTSNFRAMVQEFTGIPAPPFAPTASPFPRTRLDLFNSSMREQTRPPPYLLRPFAHKVQPPPFPSSSSSTISPPTSSTNNNYQLLSELGLSKPSQNMLNMQNQNQNQNPLLTFQSLLQSSIPQKYELNSLQGASYHENPHSRMGTLEEFNVNHGSRSPRLNELPSFLTSSSEGMLMRNNTTSSNCGGGIIGANDGNQEQVRVENYGNSSCKMNYTGGEGSLSHDKGSEQNVTSRGGGEGMVDSWICSSD